MRDRQNHFIHVPKIWSTVIDFHCFLKSGGTVVKIEQFAYWLEGISND